MGERTRDQLKYTVQFVVETMCFSDIVASDELPGEIDGVVTTLQFYGSHSGRLQLEASSTTACSLTRSFLGSKDSSVENSQTEQVVRELGAVICGRFVSALYPMADMKVSEVNPTEPVESRPETITETFAVAGGRLRAKVVFDAA